MSQQARDYMARCIDIARAQNRAKGVCEDCGGGGEVLDSSKSYPFATRKCRRCRGTGKPKSVLQEQP